MNTNNKTIPFPPIFLCGMMGSGKTTVGKTLAQKLGVPFRDLDDIIESNRNMTIRQIFAKHGESGFRKVEKKLLLEYSATSDGILALGGGALQSQELVDHLKSRGRLVFLDTPLRVLTERLGNAGNRPMISGQANRELSNRIEHLLQKRLPLYTQAHITVKTGTRSKEELADQIITQLKSYDAQT